MKKITVIGASNIDITGKATDKFTPRDSIIGKVHTTFGGVGANVAMNLSLMGEKVEFITALGGDFFAKEIENNLQSFGIDLSKSLIAKNYPSGKYMATLDETGDMVAAINEMEINTLLTREYLKKIKITTDMIFVDTNLERDTIEYILITYGKERKIVMDSVSCEKAKKLLGLEEYIYALKPNRMELETLTNSKIKTDKDVLPLAKEMVKRGVKNIFVTSGTKKIVAANQNAYARLSPFVLPARNLTGAGDCFSAAMTVALSEAKSLEDSILFASGAAALSVMSEETVNREISREKIEAFIKEEKNERTS